MCLPVPLYHCFGEVAGVIALLGHGGTTVMPSPTFQVLKKEVWEMEMMS